jgi:hypothetical protein
MRLEDKKIQILDVQKKSKRICRFPFLLLTVKNKELDSVSEIKTRQYYEMIFSEYPDVVDTETVRAMLGGIGICTVWKLIRGGHLRYIHYLEQCFLIPKDWLIDYVLSDHYSAYKHTLKSQI